MRVLLLNQAFYPDVVATAQIASNLAKELVERGHSVTVVASRRAYDDPRVQFPRKESWQGVRILRIPCLGLGKTTRWRRALNFASFLVSCVFLLLCLPAFDVVVGMTSPPLLSFVAALFTQLKGGAFVFWVMDLNPDEAVAAGWLREKSWVNRALARMLRHSLRQSERVVVLDRFMRERIRSKGVPGHKITIIPPWSHDEAAFCDPNARQVFRQDHGLSDKYVVMYSGNHSPCHPLDTLLEAAVRLADHPEIVFCFVGGGSEFEKVRRLAGTRGLSNVVCLPYQPLRKLAGSLSAADLHVVVMGDPFVGIVHPCKIYNILTVGTPFLYIGPRQSHIVDLVDSAPLNGSVRLAGHGDVEAVIQHILKSSQAGAAPRSAAAEHALAARFSQKVLAPQMVQTLESVVAVRGIPAPGPYGPSVQTR